MASKNLDDALTELESLRNERAGPVRYYRFLVLPAGMSGIPDKFGRQLTGRTGPVYMFKTFINFSPNAHVRDQTREFRAIAVDKTQLSIRSLR